MQQMNFRSRWLLLTGASSGLGREMALVLAHEYGANLVLVARREDKLRELAATIEKGYGTQTHVVAADLATPGQAERVFDEATAAHPLYGAILNAGITHFGRWDEMPWDGFEKMLQLNVSSTVRLSTLLLPYLEQRAEQGGILLVSSMAGLTPVAYQAAYSATKAFLVNFGCSLWHEMRPRGVTVSTFAPGGIDTEMTSGERFNGLRSWLMPADSCAREAISAFAKRRYLHVPGTVYRIGSVLTRLLPQRLVVGQVAAQYRKSLEHTS